jgi:hypothetical protein
MVLAMVLVGLRRCEVLGLRLPDAHGRHPPSPTATAQACGADDPGFGGQAPHSELSVNRNASGLVIVSHPEPA